MIVIKTRQPDPELEQKIRMLLEREHIEAEQISIDSWEKLVLPGLTLDGMTHEVSCNGRKVSLTRLEFDLLLMLDRKSTRLNSSHSSQSRMPSSA